MDYTVENHGSLLLIRPASEAVTEWLNDHCPDAMWLGSAMAVEPRYAGDLLFALQEEGFTTNVGVALS